MEIDKIRHLIHVLGTNQIHFNDPRDVAQTHSARKIISRKQFRNGIARKIVIRRETGS